MKKVKLALEALEVESFETVSGAESTSGTVFGHATLVCTEQWSCTSCDETGDAASCLGASCGPTCGGDCGDQTYAMHSCYYYQCPDE